MLIGNDEDTSMEYRVVERTGCTIIYGSIPFRVADVLFTSQPEGAAMDPDLARMLQANLALGLSEDIQRLKTLMEPEVIQRTTLRYANTGLSQEAIRWLAVGEQGKSCQAMFYHLTGGRPAGVSPVDDNAAPHDIDDLRRCILLVETVPECKDNLERMKEHSEKWCEILPHWEEIVGLYQGERESSELRLRDLIEKVAL